MRCKNEGLLELAVSQHKVILQKVDLCAVGRFHKGGVCNESLVRAQFAFAFGFRGADVPKLEYRAAGFLPLQWLRQEW